MEDDEIFAGNYRPHDIFDDSLPLINFRVETNQQLFAIEDENKLYTKLILDLFCAVFNSFNIFLVNYLGDTTRYKELFEKYREFAVATAGEIENFTSEALQLIKGAEDIQNPY